MSYSNASRLQFCMGHRVYQSTKCMNIHGHNYVAFVHTRTPKLDSIGEIKTMVGNWIGQNWDHSFVVWCRDPLKQLWDQAHFALRRDLEIPDKKYILNSNPTVENLAQHLLSICQDLFSDRNIEVWKVVLWETENCCAEAELRSK